MEAQGYQNLPKKERPLVVPDFRAKSVLDIDFKALKKLGVKHVLVDVDLTLRKKLSSKLEAEVQEYIVNNIKDHGFKSVNLASNNMFSLKNFSEPLNAGVFQPFFSGGWLVRKPSQKFYQKILKALNAKPEECVMIGDKLHADVYGANVAGIHTILVTPKGKDFWFDLILLTRARERRLIEKYLKKPLPIKLPGKLEDMKPSARKKNRRK